MVINIDLDYITLFFHYNEKKKYQLQCVYTEKDQIVLGYGSTHAVLLLSVSVFTQV